MSEADRPGAPGKSQSGALAELQQLIGFHLSLATTAVKSHFRSHHSGLGLTQKQIAILWLIDGCPGIIQVELARHLHVKRATMSAMVDVLSGRGLLARHAPGEVDARHVPLRLTDAGRKALGEAKRAIADHEAWVKRHFSAAERRAIAEYMKRLYEDEG